MILPPGMRIDNRYEVRSILGSGGFGAVYLGWDLVEKRDCAIKLLTRLNQDTQQQFAVEAELLRLIRNPHVPRVYAHYPTLAIPGQALVMEYIEGEDLQAHMALHGPLDEHTALTLALQILEALIHLHSQQPPIIHRDIKPANLKIDRHTNAWLLDLGIGKRMDGATAPGAQAATLQYAPLEQIQHQPTDQRSDLFALGATLYYLLAGQTPETAVDRHTGIPLTPLQALQPAISSRCTAIIERALELEPNQRYDSAARMHQEVEELLDPGITHRYAEARRLRRRLDPHDQSIKATHTFPPQQPVYGSPDPALPGALEQALREKLGQPQGTLRLYRHQAESIERARKKRDIVVVTGTASGKSMCFNLPVLEGCLEDRHAHALYLFPIKALINDQAATLEELVAGVAKWGGRPISVGRLHGDLLEAERQTLRRNPPRIALSNPDFVHWMLARHPDWRNLLARLRYIVLDEVHAYRGVFGSHVAWLLRRLLRICAHYGAYPQLICCSATIANPTELVAQLSGRTAPHLIDRDGAAKVRRHIHFWQPVNVGEGERRSIDGEAANITMRGVRQGKQVITFARARQETEQLLVRTRDTAREAKEDPSAYSAYRGGYTRADREQIELALRDGRIRGIYTTSALEMGIDIGGMQMSVLAGFPGSRMSFWQQAGRAGRKTEDAHVVLIGAPNPLDSYFLDHPEDLLYGPAEEAVIDLDNPYIGEAHLCCMAREWPIEAQEVATFPQETLNRFQDLKQVGLLIEQPGPTGAPEYIYSRSDLPHSRVGLRSINGETYQIICAGRTESLGTVGPPQLYRETHEGAIFFYQGEDYRVIGIDHTRLEVQVKPVPHMISARTGQPAARKITRPKIAVHVEPVQAFAFRTIGGANPTASCSFGSMRAAETISGYRELFLHNLQKLGEFTFAIPIEPAPLETRGVWLDIEPQIQHDLFYAPAIDVPDGNPLKAGLHGLEHLLLGLASTVALCDRRDLGSQAIEHFGGQQSIARIMIYDPFPGGIGLAERVYRHMEPLLLRAYDVVSGCSCTAGCPACIQASWCYEENRCLSKPATVYLLERILDRRGNP